MMHARLRRTAGAMAIVGAATLLSGCAWLPSWLGGAEKPKPAELTANPATLGVRQAWTARMGPVNTQLLPHVHGGTVTLASSDGSLAAFDAASGRELWRANAGGPIAAGVGSDGRISAVVTRTNDLVAFEGAKEIWRQRLDVGVYTPPFVAGGRVFLLLADRAVMGFDAQSGRRIWTQRRAAQQQPLVLRHPGVMLAVGDTLVVGQQGRLAGLNPLTGAPRWEAPVATARGISEVERLVDLVGRVSRVGDSVCVRSFQTAVGCVDAGRGTVQWTKPANGQDGVDGDGSVVFGTEAEGRVIAWKRDGGDRAWVSELLLHRDVTGPLLLGRAVVVGDGFGYVHLLDREDGKLLNRLATDGSAIAAPPTAAGNTLVVVTRNGGVYGFVPQ